MRTGLHERRAGWRTGVRRWAVLALSVVGSLGVAPVVGAEPPPLVAPAEVYEPLRCTSERSSSGHHFTVSPDEEWIAVVCPEDPPGAGSPEDLQRREGLVVLHRSSGRSWRASIPGPFDASDWYPNCFSADGRTLFLVREVGDGRTGWEAALAPGMAGLALRPAPTPPDVRHLEGTFLNFSGHLKNRTGEPVRTWSGLGQDDGEFGEMAWSPDGAVRYDAVAEGATERASGLRVSPPGRLGAVDYGPVLAVRRSRQHAAIAEMGGDLGAGAGVPPEQRRQLEALASSMMAAEEATRTIRLGRLVVSPDGRTLAGVAIVYPGPVGYGGHAYGVLIPVDRPGPVAYPVAENVYGKPIWAKDGAAVYVYAQPTPGGGEGTVLRVPVASVGIPAPQ